MKRFIVIVFLSLFLFVPINAQTDKPLTNDELKVLVMNLIESRKLIREQRDAAIVANNDKAEEIKRADQTIASLNISITALQAVIKERESALQKADEVIEGKNREIVLHEKNEELLGKKIEQLDKKVKAESRKTKGCMIGGGIGAGLGGTYGNVPGAIGGSIVGCYIGQKIEWFFNIFRF